MSNKNHAPNEKKQTFEGETSFEETREYLSQLLKRVYSDMMLRPTMRLPWHRWRHH